MTLAAYRVVQEGLINALRHAQATQVDINVHADGERMIVTIIDDGVGLPEQWALPGTLWPARLGGTHHAPGRRAEGCQSRIPRSLSQRRDSAGGEHMIRVLLVDDHAVVRTGFRLLLQSLAEVEVVAEAESGEVACQRYLELAPDVVVMDLAMPGMGGLEALRRIRARDPQARDTGALGA